MSNSNNISSVSGKRRWVVAVLLTFMAGFAGLALWFGIIPKMSPNPLFRGKPESEWIKNLKYGDDQEVREWRAYGEEGVQVLIRGLERANRSDYRAYRKFNRLLPPLLRGWLPAPGPDSTQSLRQRLVSLLWSLGSDAKSATRIMIQTALDDEAPSVRQSAIGYFNGNGDENCPLNRLPANQKKELLPAFISAIQDSNNNELHHNASIGLKYFPEEREVVAPVLVNALRDSDPYVRLYAAEALNRIAPDAAKKAGATSILVAIAKNPDDQVASKAVAALGHSGSQLDLAVSALIECLQNTNTLIACEAVWALEWAPAQFAAYSDTIIPALTVAAQRRDGIGGYAKVAQAKWKSRLDTRQGAEQRKKQP